MGTARRTEIPEHAGGALVFRQELLTLSPFEAAYRRRRVVSVGRAARLPTQRAVTFRDGRPDFRCFITDLAAHTTAFGHDDLPGILVLLAANRSAAFVQSR